VAHGQTLRLAGPKPDACNRFKWRGIERVLIGDLFVLRALKVNDQIAHKRKPRDGSGLPETSPVVCVKEAGLVLQGCKLVLPCEVPASRNKSGIDLELSPRQFGSG
jgi:hypothetical protein